MSHRGAADAFDGGVCGLSGIDFLKLKDKTMNSTLIN